MHRMTWEPQFEPLTSELLDQMVAQGWTSLQELVLWAAQQMEPEQQQALEHKMLLAKLQLDSETPRQ